MRLIARLDVKGANLVKTVQLEGLRVVGDPRDRALAYYNQGADELLYIDIVASLYGRNNLVDIVRHTAHNVFIPLTVGGGIRSMDDAHSLFKAGADKVAINTAAVARPALISELARGFGSQAVVLSLEAKQKSPGQWEAYTDNGRERTGLDAVQWAQKAADLGAGEILVTSVDREGTRRGFDVALIRAIAGVVSVPVIASGGLGQPDDAVAAAQSGHAAAVAMADCLHFNRYSIPQIRTALSAAGLEVRNP